MLRKQSFFYPHYLPKNLNTYENNTIEGEIIQCLSMKKGLITDISLQITTIITSIHLKHIPFYIHLINLLEECYIPDYL